MDYWNVVVGVVALVGADLVEGDVQKD